MNSDTPLLVPAFHSAKVWRTGCGEQLDNQGVIKASIMNSMSVLEKRLRLPSPLAELPLHEANSRGLKVYIKREDQIHPLISGNKWRKLKYNLIHFLKGDYDGIISPGGPYSNHLGALAAACQILKVPCLGLVRTSHIDYNNPTLSQCCHLGMFLKTVPPNAYAKRYIKDLTIHQSQFERPYYIPEGGSNEWSQKGCEEMLDEIDFEPDFVVLPIGTAATMAALVQRTSATVLGISPFKKDKVEIPFLSSIGRPHKVLYDYAFHGFGRYDAKIVDFVNAFWEEYNVPLDPIYNAKAVMALTDLIEQDYFPTGSKILYVHTGGLQGISGFNQLHGHKNQIRIPAQVRFSRKCLGYFDS